MAGYEFGVSGYFIPNIISESQTCSSIDSPLGHKTVEKQPFGNHVMPAIQSPINKFGKPLQC